LISSAAEQIIISNFVTRKTKIHHPYNLHSFSRC